MHVLLVSACEKRALRRSRAILDSFAMRVGPRTWSSAMTAEGLASLQAALRQQATRQTSVACFQNDGRRRMRLLWIIGRKSEFGTGGHFASGTTAPSGTSRDTLVVAPWIRVASLLAATAGLAHDFGKASVLFKSKLADAVIPARSSRRKPDPETPRGDDVRHEWISMKLAQALRKRDYDWTASWNALKQKLTDVTLGDRNLVNASVRGPGTALEALDFLIGTHHGLFSCEAGNGRLPDAQPRHVRRFPPREDQITPAAQLPRNLVDKYRSLESRLLSTAGFCTPSDWQPLCVYARAALILADHSVSARLVERQRSSSGLYANTAPIGKQRSRRQLNQPLEWHLREVSRVARSAVWGMSRLIDSANDYDSLPYLNDDTVERIVEHVSTDPRFRWQNTCSSALEAHKRVEPGLPSLVFNMAGTGSGKTRMNVRTACLLCRGRVRLSVALNLRTLTAQTGRALREEVRIGEDDIAVVYGGIRPDEWADASTEKGRDAQAEKKAIAEVGNADENPIEPAFDASGSPRMLPAWLMDFLSRPQDQELIGAPILVSTVDFLAAAGEPGEQGHYVKALLRVMNSDLILDEIDSYEPESLVAVLRIIQMAGLFGRNVICSSATLSHPVATAVERAYRSGIAMYSRLLQVRVHEGSVPAGPDAARFRCVMMDDSLVPVVGVTDSGRSDFSDMYRARIDELGSYVGRLAPRRRASLQRVTDISESGWIDAAVEAVRTLHATNSFSFPSSDVRVSFGLVRVANVDPCIQLARALADRLPNARVATYHANEFAISRLHKEARLDHLLTRKRGNINIVADVEIQAAVEAATTGDLPFIVVATSVEEIGRDHDFDWAVIEPSSSQSIVQSSGRVNRHRNALVDMSNVMILQFNLRHCLNPDLPAFRWPGYEVQDNTKDYAHHDIEQLLNWNDDAINVSAQLRFDTEHCLFARADDVAIQKRVDAYFGEADSVFTRPDGYVWTLTSGPGSPYRATPLRSVNQRREEWRVNPSSLEFEKKTNRVSRYSGRLHDEWITGSLLEVGPRTNAWLSTSPDAMREACETRRVDPERGMVAVIPIYDSQSVMVLEYDHAFGIRRVKKT